LQLLLPLCVDINKDGILSASSPEEHQYLDRGGFMNGFIQNKAIHRRVFLKRGLQSGAILISLPLWKNLTAKEIEAVTGSESAAEVPASLSKAELQKLLKVALNRGGDFAEVYFERTVQNSIGLDEDKISSASRGVDMGVGFRVVQGEKTG